MVLCIIVCVGDSRSTVKGETDCSIAYEDAKLRASGTGVVRLINPTALEHGTFLRRFKTLE